MGSIVDARPLDGEELGGKPVHKIAVIQLYAAPLEIEQNFSRACSFIRQAKSQGAVLAVLPEYHLTGWVPQDSPFAEQASQYKQYLDGYCALAKELDVCIVPGTIVEQHPSPTSSPSSISTPSPRLVNVAYFISNQGVILGSYAKQNIWHPERPYISTAGHDPIHPVIDTPLGKIGILICWDLAFPEAFRALIRAGAKTVIVPAFWTMDDAPTKGLKRNPNSEALFLDSVITARCFENTCAVVFANAGAPPGLKEGGHSDYEGLSQVAVPFLGPVGRLGNKEDMLVVDLEMEILEEAEENYKVREDLAREDWHYGYLRGNRAA